jgi:hypothetical protein
MPTRRDLLAMSLVVLAVWGTELGCNGSSGDKVGQLCDLTADAGPSQAVVDVKSRTCSTGICFKPAQAPGAMAQRGLLFIETLEAMLWERSVRCVGTPAQSPSSAEATVAVRS